MPKLIENISRQLLEETGRQLAAQGYARTTIRSVAGACGLGVGTVYNYFPSKEHMVASYVARDWARTLETMEAEPASDPRARLETIHRQLLAFTQHHRVLFSDQDAARAAAGVMLSRHLQLREQLAALIEPIAPSSDGFDARFIAEALLTWTISNAPFDRIYEMLGELIPGNKEDSK